MTLHNLDLILTFAGGLATALLLGFLARRLKLPPILGYLVASLIIGPYTPGFVANRPMAEQLAEIGVILLMFSVGMHFRVQRSSICSGAASGHIVLRKENHGCSTWRSWG